jgi:hypothetical protein
VKYIIFFFLLVFSNICLATNDLDKELLKYYKKNDVKINFNMVDDYTFVRRLYIDVAGRIPTTKEIAEFIDDKKSEKKNRLVEKLVYSEDYTNNFYNLFADILRIKPERLADNIQMRGYPYMEYVRDSLRSDKSWNTWVKEMLTATGRPTDNGATGYLLRDDGMVLDNLALTTNIFIGKSISCAQCHDDPFSDYTQKQFYELAAFFNNENREFRKNYKDILKTVDEQIKQITKTERIDNNVRQLMGANLLNIQNNQNKQLKYPFDYKYPNAKPNEIVITQTLDSKYKNSVDRRPDFSQWLTTHSDFSYALVVRLWQHLIGNNMVYPQPISDFDLTHIKNTEILIFLGKYFEQNNYSIKSLVRIIVQSDFYSRPIYTGDRENYKYQGPVIRRMTSHQVWDSLLTLVIEDTNYTRISFDEYSKLFEIDWNTVSGEKLLKQVVAIREWENKLDKNILRYKNIDLVRSCFNLKPNNFVSLFLKEFGASERILLDTHTENGTITQLLTLMNSGLSGLIVDKKSQIMQSKNKNLIFMSVMTRPINILERPVIERLNNDDLVWVLLNSHEFFFRK